MKLIREKLKELDLNEKEIKVYIYILKHGDNSLSNLHKALKMPMSSLRLVLRGLESKNLITKKENVNNRADAWVPQDPELFADFYRKEVNELLCKQYEAERLSCLLNPFFNKHQDLPSVKYIDCLEDLQKVRVEIENMDDDILQLVSLDEFKGDFAKSSKEHLLKLKERNKKIRCILVTDKAVKKIDYDNVDCVILPSALAPMKGEVSICGDMVILFSYSPDFVAVAIRSQSIANTMRGIMELAWQRAEQIGIVE